MTNPYSGAVQHSSTSYAIYWLPGASVTSANYQSVIKGYLSDVGGSSYWGLLGQYSDSSGAISSSSSFGGSWIDTASFPSGRGVVGSATAPLLDSDVQAAVNAALAVNPSWGPATTGKQFMVFLPYGVYLSAGTQESFVSGGFCAYHSWYTASSGQTVVYAAMPYADTDASGCGRPGPWPNQSGDPTRPSDADDEINILSHEHFEGATDPLLNAWYFHSGAANQQEIGDVCRGIDGPRRADGSNVTLNGHPYLVQTEWSNADAVAPNDTVAYGCVLKTAAAATTTTSAAPTSTSTSPTTAPTTSTTVGSTSTTSSTAAPTTSTTLRSGSTSTTSTTSAPTTTQPSPQPRSVTSTRLAGADRVATALAISNDEFATAGSAKAVVLTRSDGFADALAGTPLAVAKGGPLLMTPSGAPIDPRVAAEVARVLPVGSQVFVLGGAGAVDPTVDAALAPNYTVTRLAGPDRFATAVVIADQGLNNPAVQVFATGRDFPDALAGGAAAASRSGAVLLTDGANLPAATAAYMNAHPATRWALGGPAATAASAAGAVAIVGTDRYDTATQVARAFFPDTTALGLASGTSFPDALGGGVHAALHHAPLVLSASDRVPDAVNAYLTSLRSAASPQVYAYGGSAAISDATLSSVVAALQG